MMFNSIVYFLIAFSIRDILGAKLPIHVSESSRKDAENAYLWKMGYLKQHERTQSDVYGVEFFEMNISYETVCGLCLIGSELMQENGLVFDENKEIKGDPRAVKYVQITEKTPETISKLSKIIQPGVNGIKQQVVQCQVYEKNYQNNPAVIYVSNGLETNEEQISCFLFADSDYVLPSERDPSKKYDKSNSSQEIKVITHTKAEFSDDYSDSEEEEDIKQDMKHLMQGLKHDMLHESMHDTLNSNDEALDAFLDKIWETGEDSDDDFCDLKSTKKMEDICKRCIHNSDILRDNKIKYDKNRKLEKSDSCITKNVKISEKNEESNINYVQKPGRTNINFWENSAKENIDIAKANGKTKTRTAGSNAESLMDYSKQPGQSKIRTYENERDTIANISEKQGKKKTNVISNAQETDMKSVNKKGKKKVDIKENSESAHLHHLQNGDYEDYILNENNEDSTINYAKKNGKSKTNVNVNTDGMNLDISERPGSKKMLLSTNNDGARMRMKNKDGHMSINLSEDEEEDNLYYKENPHKKTLRGYGNAEHSNSNVLNERGKSKVKNSVSKEETTTDIADKLGNRKVNQSTTKGNFSNDTIRTAGKKATNISEMRKKENVNVTDKNGEKQTNIYEKSSQKDRNISKRLKPKNTVKQKMVSCPIIEDVDGVLNSEKVYISDGFPNEVDSCFIYTDPSYILPNMRKAKGRSKTNPRAKPVARSLIKNALESDQVKVLLHVSSDEDSSPESPRKHRPSRRPITRSKHKYVSSDDEDDESNDDDDESNDDDESIDEGSLKKQRPLRATKTKSIPVPLVKHTLRSGRQY